MENPIDIAAVSQRVAQMKSIAEELETLAAAFPALSSNTRRIQASIKMLELNVSDLEDLG